MNNRHNTTSLVMVILILTPFLLLSCGGESVVEEAETQVEKQDSFQSYQLDISGESIPFADLIDKIEITRLEETQESLLGYVRQVEFFEDKMVIPGDDGNIYLFSNSGGFLNRINRKGGGPEEYMSSNNVWLEGGVLGVHNYGRSVNRYDLEGNFISRIPLKERSAHLYPYKSGYALDKSGRLTQDSLQFALVILNNEMKLDKTLLPFEKIPNFQISFSNSSLFALADDLLFFPMLTDTVYRIQADTVTPLIHYDFQEDWYFKPGVEVSDALFVDVEEKRQVWYLTNRVGQEYIYLNAIQGGAKTHSFIIDRKANKSILIDKKTSGSEELAISTIGWEGDTFLLSLQSTQLAELLEQLDPSQYKFTQRSTLEEIESSENPALIRIRLKQSEDWN